MFIFRNYVRKRWVCRTHLDPVRDSVQRRSRRSTATDDPQVCVVVSGIVYNPSIVTIYTTTASRHRLRGRKRTAAALARVCAVGHSVPIERYDHRDSASTGCRGRSPRRTRATSAATVRFSSARERSEYHPACGARRPPRGRQALNPAAPCRGRPVPRHRSSPTGARLRGRPRRQRDPVQC